MDIEIVRSPARVSWLVKCNGIILEACDTKEAAAERKAFYERAME